MKTETVKVRCTGADLVALEQLTPIQGSLKALSSANFKKLKASILKHGVTFPFFVWRHENRLDILDGTQRDLVLLKMKEEGYEIPPLPVAYIEAQDLKEAKEKILIISSQYGEMTKGGLGKFIEEAALDFAELNDLVSLPNMDLISLEQFSKALSAGHDQANAATIKYKEQYGVIVMCADAGEQEKIYNDLAQRGYDCKVVVT